MFLHVVNVIFSYITDISKNIFYYFSSPNKNNEDLYSIEINTDNINNTTYNINNYTDNIKNYTDNINNSTNNTYYRNSMSCPNNLYSHDKYKIKVNKPLVINLDLRCDYCKRLIMKDKSIYCFNDKIFCLNICRAKYIKY